MIGGVMLTAAHILAAMMLNSNKSGKEDTSTFLVFLIGIIGGQGASIIFLSILTAMLKWNSIVSTGLVNLIIF